MKKKKLKKRLIVILIIAITIYGGYTAIDFFMIENIFDQIYYTPKHELYYKYSFFSNLNRRGKFKNMQQLKYVPDTEFFPRHEENYKQEYLEEETSLKITVWFAEDNQKVYFIYETGIDLDDPWTVEFIYEYTYDVPTKTLTYSTNSTFDDPNKYFLYDIFLTDWFEANGFGNRFSLNNLGDFEYIEEDWAIRYSHGD